MKWSTLVGVALIAILGFFSTMYFFHPRRVTSSSYIEIIQHLPPTVVYVHKPVPPDTVYVEKPSADSSEVGTIPPDSLCVARKHFSDFLLSPKNVALATISSDVRVYSRTPALFIGDSLALVLDKEAILAELGGQTDGGQSSPSAHPRFWTGFLSGVASTSLLLTTTYIIFH